MGENRACRWIVIVACGLLMRRARAAVPTTKPVAVSIEFLSIAQARSAIVDETGDPYFKLLQPMEMSAKTGRLITGNSIDQERDECRRRYQDAVLEFTPQEKQALEDLVTRIAPVVARSFPAVGRAPWSFIKVSPELEGGNAFTRGHHIVLSSGALESMLKETGKGAPKWIVLVQAGQMLLREQLHVVQRQRPDLFAKMYTEFWGLKHAQTIEPSGWLMDHQLLDPDAIDTHWLFELTDGQPARWIWPLQVLNGPRFRDAQSVAVMLESTGNDAFRTKSAPNGNPMIDSLMTFPQFVSRYSPSQNVYHPNQAAADLFADIVVSEDLLPAVAPPEARAAIEKAKKNFEPTRAWFEKILGS